MIVSAWSSLLTASELSYVIIETICIILKKIFLITIIMPKIFFFGIKIGKKLDKAKNLLALKPLVKTLRMEDGKRELSRR